MFQKITKGQRISKANYCAFNSSKKQNNQFPGKDAALVNIVSF